MGYFQMLNEAGGINGRKINLISLDNALSSPKAIEQTRKLIDDDGVLAEIGTVGTLPNIAVQKYLNQYKVPQVFISAGGRRFNDPQNFPWTVPFYPPFEMEGATFGKFILKKMPNAKIAVLYQNDDYGKDYLTGLKAGLGADNATKIVAEASYELSYPTIDSEILKLKASGADTLIYFTTPKFAAQGIKKANELNWKPAQFLASPVNSIQGVLTPAGLDNVQGAYKTQFAKQANDPAWAEDAEVRDYVYFMKKWAPNESPNDFIALSGYISAQAIAKGPQRRGDNLTRASDKFQQGAGRYASSGDRTHQRQGELRPLPLLANGHLRQGVLEAARRIALLRHPGPPSIGSADNQPENANGDLR
jgi:ABC-type branched-subunit amino acid transport system substrate-binding protein